jgi:parallel beta-helix repeat protein
MKFDDSFNIIVQNNIIEECRKYTYGIYLYNSTDIVVKNNTLLNNQWDAILIQYGSENMIYNNTIITTYQDGISLKYTDFNNITSNYVNNCYYDGIYLYYSEENNIENNYIVSCNYSAIHFYYSEKNNMSKNNMFQCGIRLGYSKENYYQNDNKVNFKNVIFIIDEDSLDIKNRDDIGQLIIISSIDITVKNIDVSNTTTGIIVIDSNNIEVSECSLNNNYFGIWLYETRNSKIRSNYFINNSDYGVFIQSSNRNDIENNIISNSPEGIHFYDSDNNDITGNNISNCTYGLYFSSSCENNQLSDNAFYNIEEIDINDYDGSNSENKIPEFSYRGFIGILIILSIMLFIKPIYPNLKKENKYFRDYKKKVKNVETDIARVQYLINNDHLSVADELLKKQSEILKKSELKDLNNKQKAKIDELTVDVEKLESIILRESRNIVFKVESELRILKKEISNVMNNPDKEKLREFIWKLKKKEGICESNKLSLLEIELFNERNKLEKILSKIKKIENLKTKIQKSINKMQYLSALDDLNQIKQILMSININNYNQKQMISEYEIKEKLDNKFREINSKIDELNKYLEDDDPKNSRDLFEIIKNSYRILTFGSKNLGKYYINLEQIENKVVLLEKTQKILILLMEFSKKYPRIHIVEIINRLDLKKQECEEIIKILIDDGRIKARYDDESNGIEFGDWIKMK